MGLALGMIVVFFSVCQVLFLKLSRKQLNRIPPPGMGKAPFPLRMVLCSGIPSGNMGIS